MLIDIPDIIQLGLYRMATQTTKKKQAQPIPAKAGQSNTYLVIISALALVLVIAAAWMLRRNSDGAVSASASSPETAAAAAARPPDPVPANAPDSKSMFGPTIANKAAAPGATPAGMTWIPGGEFSMGANDPPDMDEVGMKATQDARPIHRVYVDGFFMDKTDVTNAEFAKFVKATGYVTIAERKPRAEDFPGAPPENLVAGSVVFSPPDHPVPLNDHYQWWSYVHGANWRHPLRPQQRYQGQRQLPRGTDRLSRCRSLRQVGGQALADRSGMGVRRARRSRRQTICVGRLVPAEWKVDGQHPSGTLP